MNVYNIKCYFYSSREIVPFTYMDDMMKFLHVDVLGENNEFHDTISLYSVSPLFGSKKVNNGFIFNKGAIWIIRTPDKNIFKHFYKKLKYAIGNNLKIGLILQSVDFNIDNFVNNKEKIIFKTSPVFLGDNKNKLSKKEHITFKHGIETTTKKIKETFLGKINKLGYNINEENFNVEFNMNNKNMKTKSISFGNHYNVCTNNPEIIVTGNSDVIGLFYSLGIGKSTGCGFGFCFNIKN